MSFRWDFLEDLSGGLPGGLLNAIVEWIPAFPIIKVVELAFLLVTMMLIPAMVVRVVVEMVAVMKVRTRFTAQKSPETREKEIVNG